MGFATPLTRACVGERAKQVGVSGGRSGGSMSQYTRIRAGRLVDGRSETPIQDGAVLVDGNRIVAVGPADRVTAPLGEAVRERHYPGGTVMPGLIDVHAHLTFGTAGRSYE